MIDFENAEYLKLRPVKDNAFEDLIRPMFIGGEEIIQCFQTVRDGVVFTNRRIFAINIQGLVGKKKDTAYIREHHPILLRQYEELCEHFAGI